MALQPPSEQMLPLMLLKDDRALRDKEWRKTTELTMLTTVGNMVFARLTGT